MTTSAWLDVLFHPFAMMWCGQAMHVIKKLRDLEIAEKPMSLRHYFSLHPYATIFSLLAGIVAYGLMYTTGQLTVAGAFTAGYMADSLVNAFTSRELRRVEQANE